MSPTLDQMREAQRALETPLFSGLPGDIEVSFEFFPPKTEKMAETLWQSVETLSPLAPRFLSVTYGAGGSTRERTHQAVRRIASETNIPAAAHLTCVQATREEVDQVAREYWEEGVRHIVALRGDAPDGAGAYAPHPGGYENAAELIAGLKKVADFEISVAAYPEVHPDSPDRQADLDNLKRKFDAGATRAITHFFFDPECFFDFRDKAAAAGIEGEIVVLPDAASTAPLAAAALGVEVGAIANSLVFWSDDEPLLVMTSGAHRVDTVALAERLGRESIRRASAEQVREATGQAIGGVAPTGHPAPLTTVVDEDLARYPEIWAAGGTPHTVFPMTFDQLVSLTGAPVVKVD